MEITSDKSLLKPEAFETKRVRLISPCLHIGSQYQRLNRFEYVQAGNKVYLQDQEALARALHQKGKLPEYIRAIDENRNIIELLRQAFGSEWQNASDTSDNPIFPTTGISQGWAEKVTELRPMIRDGFGRIYIPGTSIKGAIRTAIIYHLIKHGQVKNAQRSDIENRLYQKLKENKIARNKHVDAIFMEQVICDFNLRHLNGKLIFPASMQNRDLLRAIRVSDSTPLLPEDIKRKDGIVRFNRAVSSEVLVTSHFEDNKAKYRASIYAELMTFARTEFTVSIDHQLLTHFSHREGMDIPFKNVQDILDICKEYTQDQWQHERKYWTSIKNNPQDHLDFHFIRTEFYGREDCQFNMRLGWGSGMMGTTIDLLLEETLCQQIRDAAGIKAPGFRAPKSRRSVLDQDGDIKLVPGWAQLRIIK
jgi:CRISPR-associated protein Csm5